MNRYSVMMSGVVVCMLSMAVSAICAEETSKRSPVKTSEPSTQDSKNPDHWDNLSVQSFQGAHTDHTNLEQPSKGRLVGLLVGFRAKHTVEFAKEDEFISLLYGEPLLRQGQGEPMKTVAWDIRLRDDSGSNVRCERIHIDRGESASIGYHFRAPKGTKVPEGKWVQGIFVFEMPANRPESELQGSQFTFTMPGYKPIVLRFPQEEMNMQLEKGE